MQALPGRAARARPEAPPASVTRAGAHADQRRRILRSIAELVAENGYAEVTVELIVKRARCSYKTFYKHFAGKEECFIALFETAVSTTEEEVRRRLAEEPLPWSEQVVLALRTLVDLILAEPAVARAVIVESLTIGPEISARYERAIAALVPLFRAGRDLNPRGAELPETIEDTLAGSVFWSAYERLVVGEASALPDHLPVLAELILRTYLGPADAARIVRSEVPEREPALA
jgi:AcrR family transcriptional regulator